MEGIEEEGNLDIVLLLIIVFLNSCFYVADL